MYQMPVPAKSRSKRGFTPTWACHKTAYPYYLQRYVTKKDLLIKIICDSREQKPISLVHEFISETIVKKLDFGDYAGILEDGTMLPIVFERKSCSDLYGTMGKGNRRFKRELERCIAANFKMYLIIEGSFTKICKGYKHSKLKPLVLLRILGTMWDRYEPHFQPIFCTNRKEMESVILWRFFSAAKEHVTNTKKKRVKKGGE